jgi:hypothetical protein
VQEPPTRLEALAQLIGLREENQRLREKTARLEEANNFGERNLRPSVLWRKGSFGTWSEAGSRFAERMMTVVATLKLQHRNVLDHLVHASEAALLHQPAPSILPLTT